MEILAEEDSYQQRSVDGDDDFISLSSNDSASVGKYSIKVDALATEHKLSSTGFVGEDPVGEGKLTLASGDNSFDIEVSSADTLSDIRDAINDSTDNDSMVATIIICTCNETRLTMRIRRRV